MRRLFKPLFKPLLFIGLVFTLLCLTCQQMTIRRRGSSSGSTSEPTTDNSIQLKFANLLLKNAPQKNVFDTLDLTTLYKILFEDKISCAVSNACSVFSQFNHKSTRQPNDKDEPFTLNLLFGLKSVSMLQALETKHPLHLVYATCNNQSFDINLLSPELLHEIKSMDGMSNVDSCIDSQYLLNHPELYGRIISYLTEETISKGNVFTNFPDDAEIEKKFVEQEAIFHYYDGISEPNTRDRKVKEAKMSFIKAFKLAKIIADYIEDNNTPDDSLAVEHAYKMVLFFGPNESNKNQADILRKCAQYLQVNYSKLIRPMYDAFSTITISNHGEAVTLSKWQELISKHGPIAMKLFGRAYDIEKKLGSRPPANLKEAQKAYTQLKFSRANENIELAQVALHYPGFTEDHFNRSLEIFKNRKTSDKLPDITIDGATVGHPGYWLTKLPIDDPRACLLGHITNCCQSIGGHAEECVKDGIQREKNGFYVLLKAEKKNENSNPKKDNGQIDYNKYKIVGQGYTWISQKRSLVFDSWENLRTGEDGGDDLVIFDMLKAFGLQVLDRSCGGIHNVVIGRGGKTPRRYRLQKEVPTCLIEKMSEGSASSDSKNQSYICHGFLEWLKADLPNLDIENLATYTDIDMNVIVSCRKARKKLSTLPSDDLRRFFDFINENNSSDASIQALDTKFFTNSDLLSLRSVDMESYKLLTNNEIMNLIFRRRFSFNGFKNLSKEKLRTISQSLLLKYHSANCDDSWKNFKKRNLNDDNDDIETLYLVISLESLMDVNKFYTIVPDAIDLISMASPELNEKLRIINSGSKTKELVQSKKYTLKGLTDLDIKSLQSVVAPI